MTSCLIKENVKSLLSERKITCRAIASNMGEKERNVSNQINGDTVLSWEVFLAAIQFLPDLSMEWLIRGSGEKLLSARDKQPTSNPECGYLNMPGAHHNSIVSNSPGATSTVSEGSDQSRIDKLQADIEKRDTKIAELQQERENIINERDARIRELEDEISRLRQENSSLIAANTKLIMTKL